MTKYAEDQGFPLNKVLNLHDEAEGAMENQMGMISGEFLQKEMLL